jgi:hypothetical protein
MGTCSRGWSTAPSQVNGTAHAVHWTALSDVARDAEEEDFFPVGRAYMSAEGTEAPKGEVIREREWWTGETRRMPASAWTGGGCAHPNFFNHRKRKMAQIRGGLVGEIIDFAPIN